MKKVLLHICCGVCALFAIKRLWQEGFSVEGFFYNPNIMPWQEYVKRRDAAIAVCRLNKIAMIEGSYDSLRWLDLCREYKDEKEGGQRCTICYRIRLEETLKICRQRGYDYFTTTLSISPHKKSGVIFQIGQDLGGGEFLPIDFKKDDGFKKTMELAKEHQLYRQNYCGCVYST